MTIQVRRYAGFRCEAAEGTGNRKPEAEAVTGGGASGQCRAERSPLKKLVRPTQRRKAAQHLIEIKMRSERRACELMNIRRSVFRYESRRDDSALRQRLTTLATEYPRYGYTLLHGMLAAEKLVVNPKRTY